MTLAHRTILVTTLVVGLGLLAAPFTTAFAPHSFHTFRSQSHGTQWKLDPTTRTVSHHPSKRQQSSSTSLFSSPDEEFSREVRLRTEAESPFVKVRYFFYLNAAGGAFTSLAISIARIAAALAGVNTDLMDESLWNAGIDIAGLVVVGFLWRRDSEAEQSRLKRATKGAELAKLTVRASKTLLGDVESGTFTTTLSSLRQGRGIDKRVVIAAAGVDKIAHVLKQATELQDEISYNDLLIVPVVMPRGVAPEMEGNDSEWAPCLALPVGVGSSWKDYVEAEAAEAIKQGVNVEEDGICIVLKKNGRVGQRTKGIFLQNLVGNVMARREAGMDVTNI